MDKDEKPNDAAAQPKPGEESREAPQLTMKESIAAHRAELESAIDEGRASGATPEAEAWVRQLHAQGKSADEIVKDVRNRGMLGANAEAVVAHVLAQPEAAAEGEAEAERDLRIVELPPGAPGEAPIQLEIDDPEARARIQRDTRLAADYQGRSADLAARERDLQAVEHMLSTDPVAWLAMNLTDERKAELLAALSGEVPSSELLERYRRAETESRVVAHASYQGQVVRDAVERLIPAGMPDEDAVALFNDMLRDAANFARQNPGLREFPLAELPKIVERRLARYGVDLNAAAARLAGRSGAPGTPAAEVGKKFAERGVARRSAVAVPGGGAGARPTKLEPPPKQNVKERLAWLRNLVKPKA